MGRTLHIPTPKVFEPLLHPARYKGLFGGRGSGKSWFFAQALIEQCLVESTRAVCVREFQRSLEQSVKRLLEDTIDAFGLDHDFRVMNTHIETPGDGIIIFEGMSTQTKESIKSLEGYSICWVEEAQSLSQRSLDLLRPTIREPRSEMWFSWNPRTPKDPVDKLLRSVPAPPSSVVVGTTYRDNPWFPDVLLPEVAWDQKTDPEKYAHIWLGEYEKKSEARVFKNWKVDDFDTPADAVFYYGADWGFSADPTVLVRCFLEQPPATTRQTLYVDREVYKIGCEIDHTPDLFDTLDEQQARLWPIVADSARPETISYLHHHGYPRIESAVKGANSLKEGVIFLQGLDIIVHPRCVHTIDELTMYSYKTDALTGIITPMLEDKKNHVIDALRYATERLRGSTTAMLEAVWGIWLLMMLLSGMFA